MLFSATQTRKVEDLARVSLKKEPLYVGVDDNKDNATVDGLEQVNIPFVATFRHILASWRWTGLYECFSVDLYSIIPHIQGH